MSSVFGSRESLTAVLIPHTVEATLRTALISIFRLRADIDANVHTHVYTQPSQQSQWVREISDCSNRMPRDARRKLVMICDVFSRHASTAASGEVTIASRSLSSTIEP